MDEIFKSSKAKIIEILVQEEELNISEIARRLGLNHNTAKYHINYLAFRGFVKIKQFGKRIKIITLNGDQKLNTMLKELNEYLTSQYPEYQATFKDI